MLRDRHDGLFPEEVRVPVSYGPRVRAIAVYLLARQHIPTQRTAEAMADLFGVRIAEAIVEAGMLIGYRGVVVHDRLALYWRLKKAKHGLCAAHLLRDLASVGEVASQSAWAAGLAGLLVESTPPVVRPVPPPIAAWRRRSNAPFGLAMTP